MSTDIDDLTISYEEDGQEIVQELDKAILSRGAWTTIIFKYQQWEPAKQAYGPERFTIRRYRKIQGAFRQQSKFNISNKDQAQQIITVLQGWL
jgi:hypothetical protein